MLVDQLPILRTSITKDEVEELVTELQSIRTSLLIIRNGEDDAVGSLCRKASDALIFLFRKNQKSGQVEYNICKTCGACDGCCGMTIDGECLNCYHTREQGKFVLHAELDRTPEELARTGAILQ